MTASVEPSLHNRTHERIAILAQAHGVSEEVVRRVLAAGRDRDPRYVAYQCAADEPATTPKIVLAILAQAAHLEELPRHVEFEVQRFLGEPSAGGLAGLDGDGQAGFEDRQALVAGARARLEGLRSRAELDEVLGELRAQAEMRARMRALDPGIVAVADAIMAGDPRAVGDAALELAEELAPQAALELGDAGQALDQAIDLVAERIAVRLEVRRALREAAMLKGVLVVRAGQPGVLVPARLAEVRREVQHLVPREVRDLARRAREASLELRIELAERDALAALEALGGGTAATDPSSPGHEALLRALHERILPLMSRELAQRLLARANRREIEAVAETYERRLDALPLEDDEVLAIDPGYAYGCRLATVRRDGRFVDHGTFELLGGQVEPAHAVRTLAGILRETEASVIGIAIGEGHQELHARVRDAVELVTAEERGADADDEDDDELDDDDQDALFEVFLVDGLALDAAAGAPPLKDAHPSADARLRRAIATARRLLDPFVAWSEVDPRAVAAAYEWTELDPASLARQLDETLRTQIALRGLNLESAAEPLIARVPGIDRNTAMGIVRWRRETGGCPSREALLASGVLPPGADEEAIGFLLVSTPGADPLDATTVHPRHYEAARRVQAALPAPLARIRAANLDNQPVRIRYDAVARAAGVSEDLARDLVARLVGHWARPDGERDLAEEIAGCTDDVFEELIPGMEVRGTVGDVVGYGAFVDIGNAQPALIHISELAERYVPDPRQIVRPGDEVVARVLAIEAEGARVALSLRRDRRAGKPAAEPPRTATRPAMPGTATRRINVRDATARIPTLAPPLASLRYPQVGDIIQGRVQRVVDYGAFIEFGLPRAGLLHRSEMSAGGEIDPRAMLEAGDRVVAQVIVCIPEQERIGLSLIDLPQGATPTFRIEEPWPHVRRDPTNKLMLGAGPERRSERRSATPALRELVAPAPLEPLTSFAELQPGMHVDGRVSKVVSYGIFIDLGIDAPALVHVSEIAEDFVRDPGQVVHAGERVRARVLRVDRENHCIALSLRDEGAGRLA